MASTVKIPHKRVLLTIFEEGKPDHSVEIEYTESKTRVVGMGLSYQNGTGLIREEHTITFHSTPREVSADTYFGMVSRSGEEVWW